MIFVELIEWDGNRMKCRKGKDKQRQIKIRKNKAKQTKKTVKRKVISVIKIGICVLILNGKPYRVSLEILLHDFCAFEIFSFVSSKVMSKQLANIVEVTFFKGF